MLYREFCQVANSYPAGIKFALVLLQSRPGMFLVCSPHALCIGSSHTPCLTLPPPFRLGAKPLAASQVHPARLCGSRRSGRTAGCRRCNAELFPKAAEGLMGHNNAVLVDMRVTSPPLLRARIKPQAAVHGTGDATGYSLFSRS